MIALLLGGLALCLRAVGPATVHAAGEVVGRATGDLVLRDLVVAAAYTFLLLAAVMLAVGGVATALRAAGVGTRSRAVAGCVRLTPVIVRRVVLAGCGTALSVPLLTGLGQAAVSGHDVIPTRPRDAADLSGLALPDLPTAPPRSAPAVLVRPGDSLWSIAAEELGAGASDTQIAQRADHLHRLNQRLIGKDPDLIIPGTELTLRRNP